MSQSLQTPHDDWKQQMSDPFRFVAHWVKGQGYGGHYVYSCECHHSLACISTLTNYVQFIMNDFSLCAEGKTFASL